MANWAGNYTLPFTQGQFYNWWKTNYATVGKGITVSPNGDWISVENYTGGCHPENILSDTTFYLKDSDTYFGQYVQLYKLKYSNSMFSGKGHFRFFQTMDGCIASNSDNYKIKDNNNRSVVAKFRWLWNEDGHACVTAIKLKYPGDGQYYYYIIGREYAQCAHTYTEDSIVAPSPSAFEPYQPIQFNNTPSITVSRTLHLFSSSYYGADDPVQKSANFVLTDSFYPRPGTLRLYAQVKFPAISNLDAETTYTVRTDVTISDWAHKDYSIETTGSSYSLYTGKQVGNDFLSAYKIKCRKWNSYGEEISYPKQALELSKMSKTVISESDANFTFNYDISDITETSVTSISSPVFSSIHRLKSGSGKFANISRKTSYELNEQVSALNFASAGSLTYDDDTTISLANVSFISSSTTSSLGTLPHTVTIDTPSIFTVTYQMNLQYFGQLEFTDTCNTAQSAQVKTVVLEDYKSSFTPNQVIEYGSNAKLKVYNFNDELVKTITSANIGSYATNVDEKYGQYASNYLQDGAIRLTFMAYGIQVEQNVYVTYDEETLLLDISNVTTRYIFDPEDTNFDFDYTGLVVSAKRHTNNSGGVTVTTRQLQLNDLTITHDTLDTSNGREYGISISYTNEYGQTLTGTFTIYAEPLAPQSVAITYSGDMPNSLKYYDNNQELFKLPSGVQMEIIFNDPTRNVVVNDLTDFDYYRDAEHTNPLSPGVSVITRSGGGNIYVRSKTYNVYGFYAISWLRDDISQVNLGSQITIYLGNKLNKERIKQQVELRCTHLSGVVSVINTPSDWNFSYTSVVLSPLSKSECTVVIPNEGTFEIENYAQNVVWENPYAVMTADDTNFQTEYNNTVDVIDPSGLTAKIKYYEDNEHTILCDYEQNATYSSTSSQSYDKFNVTGLGDLNNYGFGTQKLNITMSGTSLAVETIRLNTKKRFTRGAGDATDATVDVTIHVIEILDITGIKLLNAKTTYNVGETFLNENDDTQIMIYYNDANHQPRTYTCYLRSGLTALNIYPLKGTKFENVTSSLMVTVTSANNYNVSVQYSISVKANYVYGDTKSHNLVALAIDDYECPDGITRSKYFLVERSVVVNAYEIETTRIDEVTGERVIADGFDITDLNVLGYLEDIGEEGLNARVILFKDYISPIEGSNNITVKFPCYVEGNADLINKCHFGIMFGNNNSKNRLFLSGNKEFKNKDWHSSEIDSSYTDDTSLITENYGYFEDLSECIYGETDNAVVAYDIVSNDKLLVLKDYSDKETTVYFRQPQLVTAINGSGTAVTGINDETLYQEEFSLSKGNNSVAGISPKAIVNFNGDTLFISNDKQVVGLDLTGIVGDNQRYANSRSYYIDEELKHHDFSNAFLWTNNKYLFVVLEDKIFVTHYETKHDNQYEWFLLDVKNVSCVFEKDEVIYLGRTDGTLHKFSQIYKDAKKVFAGYGITRLSVNEETELITASEYLSVLDEEKKYFFKPVPFTDLSADDDPYIYYSIGTIMNDETSDCDFYVNNADTRNVIELVCRRNGEIDDELRSLLLKRISENDAVYFNKINSRENVIACQSNSIFEQVYGKKCFLREYSDIEDFDRHLYQVIDENGEVLPVKQLYRARLCARVTREMEMTDIDVENGTFKLMSEGEPLDIVQYSSQALITAFRGEIIEYSNVEAFYITKPYTMGSVEYFKTVWSFTLTNDTNIPSEVDLCCVNNKIPYEKMKTLAYITISKESMGFDMSRFNFAEMDFDKNVVSRTYTHKRILSNVKFLCFGFKNYSDSNSVLSSLSVTYTVPYPSYSGD